MKARDRLDSLQVVSPCTVSWSSMKGDDAVRFCGKCRRNVYSLAAMTRVEAVEVIDRLEGRGCIRLTRRRDGTVTTGDCWAVLRRARRRGLVAFVLALPVIVFAQVTALSLGLRKLSYLVRDRPEADTWVVMGAMREPSIVDRLDWLTPPHRR
jgi:hypothetical protein